jgi:hypothetical protein
MIKRVKKTVAKTQVQQSLLDVDSIPGLKVIPLQTRKFVEFNFDFTNLDKVEIVHARPLIPIIRPDDIRNAIVKVSIRIRSEDAHKIDVKTLEQYIRQYAYVIKPIIPIIQKERRIRIKNITTDMNPLDAIKIWLANREVKNSDLVYELSEQIIRGAENES